ncbi:hypothetical protein CVIRNUC_005517 [Coccomyxa viridis]|uniref:Uncharacterized protein n=1 Tax=Coccomyxa viridis TaxID=1274662 RepID=A0AAV1I922_9CHLO|nr:hypothetical protein CVIRNUC_005517 [Coccomyxa viridis]
MHAMGKAMISIDDALAQMGTYVRKGEFAEAASLGNQARIPLGVPKAALHLKAVLFEGQQGSVSQRELNGTPVAVKRARISTGQDLDNFRREISLMSRMAHPNVVSLLAACVLPPDYMLVMELEGDNLAYKLHQEGWRPSWPQVARIALGLASALAAIHAAGILHRDVKTGNLLMSRDGGAVKLGDFGIAELAADLEAQQHDRSSLVGRGKPSGGFHKRHLVGTLEYMAPEVLQKQPTTAASDVYAWAVTVNEIATGIFPFADCTKDNPQCQTVLNFGYGRQELAAAVAAESLRPIMAADTPPELVCLLEAAWQLQPDQRLTAAQLEAKLQSLANQLEKSSTRPGVLAEQEGTVVSHLKTGHTLHAMAAGADKSSGSVDVHTSKANGQAVAWFEADACSYQPEVTVGSFETAGLRGEDRMEDRHIICSPLTSARPGTHLIGIFDGHRGWQAAQHAAEHFQEHLLSQTQRSDAGSALRAAFLSLDSSFARMQDDAWAERKGRLGSAAGERPWPGATAIVLLLHAGRLYVSNAGDCRAVLCREGNALPLSRDHTAEQEDERQRIVQAGGQVNHVMGSWRIGQAGIQVSRCLGDHDLKGSGGLSADPEVISRDMDESDAFVIVASDGLWDCISNEEAVNIVHDTVKEPAMCAKRLATEALTRGSSDNITVVVAFLQPVSTIERIYADCRQKYAAHQMFLPAKRSMKVSRVEQRSVDELRDTY